MKIITSPAKLMSVEYSSDLLKTTTPRFIKEAAEIQNHLKEKTPRFLSKLMEISSKLADENWQRNQEWTDKPSAKKSSPALFAFIGEVYRGLNAKTLQKNAIDYLQNNCRILSGLYGLLRPSDRIMPYRLEMGRKFEFEKYRNLYQFWTEKVTKSLNEELKEGELLLNLASNEYAKVIDKKKLKTSVIECTFKQIQPDGKMKTIVVYTKHARGLMMRYCAENNVKTLDRLRAFNLEGYLLSEELSKEYHLVFTRLKI